MKNFGSYSHEKIEKKIYSFWEKKKLFKPIKNKDKKKILFYSYSATKCNWQLAHGSRPKQHYSGFTY